MSDISPYEFDPEHHFKEFRPSRHGNANEPLDERDQAALEDLAQGYGSCTEPVPETGGAEL